MESSCNNRIALYTDNIILDGIKRWESLVIGNSFINAGITLHVRLVFEQERNLYIYQCDKFCSAKMG